MKISAGMIVLNSDFVLRQTIESVLPFVDRLYVSEGPVAWWQSRGIMGSTDETMDILSSFGDKVRVVRGTYAEKTEQCRAWFSMVPSDTDYVLCVDADEVHKPEHLESMIRFLEREQPKSMGFRSNTFFGGFDYVMGGFEADHDFVRVLKYEKGCEYLTHRAPTLSINGTPIQGRHVTGRQLFEATGHEMFHYSYVSPSMVHQKLQYYENAVISSGNCVPNYFDDIWLKWVIHPELREQIERDNKGVHEFIPSARGDAFTLKFNGHHPDVITRDMAYLQDKFKNQLFNFI
jgi:glycosyltransferase involved in cell wall biosynthesis